MRFRTDGNYKAEVTIPGTPALVKTFEGYNTIHKLPILGLYPDSINTINVRLTSENGRSFHGTYTVKTNPIPDFFPSIEIVQKEDSKMENGFNLIEMLIANNGKFHLYSILFDENGTVRWYMDMSEVGQIAYNGGKISNGNWLYMSWIDLYELSDLGEMIKNDKLWKYAGTHEIIDLGNERILMGGSKNKAIVTRQDGEVVETRYDYVVEWDRSKNEGTREWDLASVLDIDRSVFPQDYNLDGKADWFHINSIAMDGSENILASGRNQGIVKIDKSNNPIWILAPNLDWGRAGRTGNGIETSPYLLKALDRNGNILPENVQNGSVNHEEFEWSMGQHSLNILENGNLLIFDNGISRNFQKAPTYSRAVEYEIDDEKKTIKQVWEYGKDRQLDMFSPITSDVDILPKTGNRLITAGNVRLGSLAPHGKLVELTYPDNKVVFEANIFFRDPNGLGTNEWGQLDVVFRGE